MRKLILTALVLALTGSAFAQQRWQRTYGGTSYDAGMSVKQTFDGGYIVVGNTSVMPWGYLYLVKVDSLGDTLWTRRYGTFGADGNCVQQTSDTGYIIVGDKGDYNLNPHVYLLKTNAQGDTLWTRTYGGSGSEFGWCVQQTRDGGYIISGETSSFGAGGEDVYLIKTDAHGDTLWTRTYGGIYDDYGGKSVQQTYDGGYIVAGATYSFGPGILNYPNVYLIKTNSQGDTVWTRWYGGDNWDEGWCVLQTPDSCYIVAGMTGSGGAGGGDVYLIKTDAQGDTLWTKTYGGTQREDGHFVQQTRDGGFILTGDTWSYGAGNEDVYLVKTNAQGDTLWSKTFGGVNDDEGWCVQQTQDSGYIVTGYTKSFGAGLTDVYLIKTDANGPSGVEKGSELKGKLPELGFKVEPNPFVSFTRVPGHEAERLSLYDISGRKVGVYKGDRIGSGLSAGVYFLKLEGQDAKPVRIVKLR